MGLDMYLTRKTYVKNWEHKNDKWSVSVKKNGKKFNGVDASKIKYIEEEVGYWRKANHIHRWFVENIQGGKDDCGDYEVPLKELVALRDLCLSVLDAPDKAAELLPTQSGFFFGGTQYDEYYLQDVRDTVEILNPLIEAGETPDGWYLYHSSW